MGLPVIKAIPHNSRLTAQAPLRRLRHGICVAKMLDNVGLRYPHRASGAKAPRTLRPLPLLRFAVSATGGAHLCSIQYYLRFWLSSCRTSLAVSALRIMRYCPKYNYYTAQHQIWKEIKRKKCPCAQRLRTGAAVIQLLLPARGPGSKLRQWYQAVLSGPLQPRYR